MVARSNGHLAARPHEMSHEEALLETAVAHHHRLVEVNRKLFSYSHPVDEWASSLGAPVPGAPIVIQPTYEIPERIESVLVITPAASTGLVLHLGNRHFPVTAGVWQLTGVGILLNRDENRTLDFTALTGPYVVELCGWAIAPEDTD